jgi:P22 coat protein - gene protein 5
LEFTPVANTILTINMITRIAVRLWKNTNNFMRNLNTQYDDQYARTGAKIGSQLRIRLPVDFTVRHGAAAQFQDVSEQFTTLTMATQDGVDMSFPSIDLTLSVDDFAERYIAPAVNNLAGDVAVGVMSGAEGGVCNYVDNQAAGAIITPSNNTFLTANAILDTQSAPVLNHRVVVNPFTDARVSGALAGLFNPATEISDQYRSGGMKNALGLDWMKDQTVIMHTSGTFTAGTVNGAGQTGTTITVNAITGTLARGDIITFAGCNGVNHITKQSYGQLRQFVVVNPVASGGTSITIYPALIPSSGGNQVQYQTVDNSPANSAAIVLQGPANTTYRKNIVFVPDAITMATADLDEPPNVEFARHQYDGVSMRIVRQYVIGTDQTGTRLDVVWGALWVRPEWAVVVPDLL